MVHFFFPWRPRWSVSRSTEPQKIKKYTEIKLGTHGVIVIKGNKKGVFLPQVATENNWDIDTFMQNLCKEKAGLKATAYKTDKKLEIYVFTTETINS